MEDHKLEREEHRDKAARSAGGNRRIVRPVTGPAVGRRQEQRRYADNARKARCATRVSRAGENPTLQEVAYLSEGRQPDREKERIERIMITPNPYAESVRVKPPGAMFMLLAALAVYFAAMVAFASPAHADVLKVTNKKDSGAGSLRAAIENAAPSGDTIVFSPRVRGTITLTGRDLDIDKNLTIRGPGADRLTISGNNSDRIFYIGSGKTVKVSGLTITKGDGWYEGGGIRNYGNLTLIKSVVSGNYAEDGGGISNNNVLRLIESTVSNNFADDRGGGIDNQRGTLIVERSTISGNKAAKGGGIANGQGDSAVVEMNLTSDTPSGEGQYQRVQQMVLEDGEWRIVMRDEQIDIFTKTG